MPWTRRAGILWLVGLLVAVGLAPARAQEPPTGLLVPVSVDTIVREAMAAGPIVGLSVAAARGGQILFAAGYGLADLENGVPATPATIYHFGSITKPFTAAAVVQLVEAGKIRLDDEITRFLPSYPVQGHRVTVQHLLTHTSGIKNYLLLPRWQEAVRLDLSHEQLVHLFRNEPFDFPPGEKFVYSNSGYYLLGLIVEQAAGQPYPEYLKARMFDPLKLASTAYCEQRPVIKGRARGYEIVDGVILNADYLSMTHAYAAGAVCGSALDLVRWVRSLADGRLVSQDGFRRMSTAAILTDGTPIEYGQGLALSFVEGHPRVSHLGGIRGFASQFAHYPGDDLTVVVLTNTENAKAATIEARISRALLGLPPPGPERVVLSKQELDYYTGTYDLGFARVTVVERDGKLVAMSTSVLGSEGYKLTPQGDHRFVADEDSEVRVTFELRSNRVRRMVVYRKGITMRAERVE
jgi:CubicO group peptidase (beta-lactamase class C family)